MKEATAGLDVKISKIDYERLNENSNDDQLENNVEVETFSSKMSVHLLRYDMRAIFTSFPILEDAQNNESDRFRSGKTVNLIKDWDMIGPDKEITLKEIAKSIAWMKMYAKSESATFLEDIEWSHMFLLNSMDENLQDSVHASLEQDFSLASQGGPLMFAIMVDKIINLSEGAIESMVSHLKGYKISTVPGEDIEKVCRRFQFALKRLENNGSLTKDVIASLFKVFQTTSVTEFNKMFALWKCTIDLEGSQRTTYTTILNKASAWYKNMKIAGDWTALDVTKSGSAFNVTGDENITCHQCGKTGHKRPQCPDLLRQKKALTIGPTSSDIPISDNPVRYEKVINGKPLKWCAKCGGRRGTGKWNATHFTDQHVAGWRADSEQSSNRTRRANLDSNAQENPAEAFQNLLAQAASLSQSD